MENPGQGGHGQHGVAQHALAQGEEGGLHRRRRFRARSGGGGPTAVVRRVMTGASALRAGPVVPARCGYAWAWAGSRARIGVVGACRLRSGHLKALPVSRLLLWAESRSGDRRLPRFVTLARTPARWLLRSPAPGNADAPAAG
ncbi:hypothetical protein GCM10010424_41690 [Streptomyces lienomycini]